MEVFGLAAGVLQVAGFGAEVSSTLFKCAKKFHNASKELEEIASQVETVAVSLRQVDSLLKDPTTKAVHTPKLYEDTTTVSNGCLDVFRELDSYVKGFESKSGLRGMTLRSKLAFCFDSSKLTGLGNVLRRYSDVLHLMISVMAIVEGRRAATKDELQALEANLKLLALSNKDLSQSNKTLTDTIAAISQASVAPFARKATIPPVASPVTASQGISRAIPVTSLLAMPPVNLPPIVPRKQDSFDQTTDHLQRCMKSVQELALTISCALDTLYGHEKTGSSDIHGCYERLSKAMAQLPTHLQCDQCKQTVPWSHFEPASDVVGQSDTCKCRNPQDPVGAFTPGQLIPITSNGHAHPLTLQNQYPGRPPKLALPSQEIVAAPAGFRKSIISARRGSTMPGSFPMPMENKHFGPLSESKSDESSESEDYRDQAFIHEQPQFRRREHSPRYEQMPLYRDIPSHREAGQEFNHTTVTEPEAQARPQLLEPQPQPQMSDATSLSTMSIPSSTPLDTESVARLRELHYIWGRGETIWSSNPTCKLAGNNGDTGNSSSGNKSTRFSNESDPSNNASASDPPGGAESVDRSWAEPKQSEPVASQSGVIPMIAHPSSTQQGEPKQGSRNRKSALSQATNERCPKMPKRVPNKPEDGSKKLRKSTSCVPFSDDRDRFGGDQQRQPYIKMKTGGHATAHSGNNYEYATITPLRSAYDGTAPSLPTVAGAAMDDENFPFGPGQPLPDKNEHLDTVSGGLPKGEFIDLDMDLDDNVESDSLPEDRTSEDRSIRDNSASGRRGVSSPPSYPTSSRRHMFCRSDQDEKNTSKTSDGKEGQTDTTTASVPEPPATPAPVESPCGSGHLADETSEPIDDFSDFSDYNAERYFDEGESDGLDNFDFDHLIEDDDQGLPDFGDRLGDGGYQEHTPQLLLDTENVPPHGKKRSHSDAFQGSPEYTASSERPPRRNKACEPLAQADDRPADNNNNESFTESLSRVQALLQRWFDASTTDVLLRPSDD